MASSLLDESVTWADFGKQHLDRRITKAITKVLALERPTLVQSRGIPVALEGKDLLCRARTGSGKTLAYAVPLVQRLLVESERGSVAPLRGLILVPTKELVVQVHEVLLKLLHFCNDVLTVESLLSGQKYMKAELPHILVTSPSSVLALLKQRAGTMQPLNETLKVLIVDEADLMFSFGYENDVKALCATLPSTYQAMLVSATLSEEVEQLKGLMLHKPVVLKLEEPRVTGKLTQFYFQSHKEDKYLILYTLLKLQLVQGKVLMFVSSVDNAYRLKIVLERFSMSASVLNAELPHASRQNIIQSFNQSLIDLLIATDEGFRDVEKDEPEDDDSEDEEAAKPKKKQKKKKAAEEAAAAEEEPTPDTGSKKKKKKAAQDDAEQAEITVDVSREQRSFAKKKKATSDDQYSITRGVDLVNVSTVINIDMPATVRNYTHRVGRCARGGASGTALTLCCPEDEGMLNAIIRVQAASGNPSVLKQLPMQMSDVERFRYRVEDMSRGLTRKAIAQYRSRELQLEVLNSEKLKTYFEEHPEERRALQRAQRTLRERKSVRKHLAHIPNYLVPEQFSAATPVQQAVREAGGTVSNAVKRKRALQAKKSDPLQGFKPGAAQGRKRFTREYFEAQEKRINPNTANVEDLPPLSGRKLWKMKKGKHVRKKTDHVGERKRQSLSQRKAHKKIGI